jgi:Holliday junction DNA helicase RuvA
MIGRLKGTVVFEAPDGVLVIDVNGVGYEVVAPLGTLGRAPRDEQGHVTLQIHTNVREDAIVLYGFPDDRERTAFRLLTAVAGVGPKIAVAILGAIPASDLVGVVARGDVRRFQAVPGVGKKIAERLALELKDKLASGVLSTVGGDANGAAVPTFHPALTSAGAGSARNGAAAGPMGALVTTLIGLGFKPLEAERAAAELKDREREPLDALVRAALKVLTH